MNLRITNHKNVASLLRLYFYYKPEPLSDDPYYQPAGL